MRTRRTRLDMAKFELDIYKSICNNPGVEERQIVETLQKPRSTVRHCLLSMMKRGIIMGIRPRREKRYYDGFTSVEREVYILIKKTPGLTQKEIMRKIGKVQATTSYQLAKLEERNIIYAEKIGRERRYY